MSGPDDTEGGYSPQCLVGDHTLCAPTGTCVCSCHQPIADAGPPYSFRRHRGTRGQQIFAAVLGTITGASIAVIAMTVVHNTPLAAFSGAVTLFGVFAIYRTATRTPPLG